MNGEEIGTTQLKLADRLIFVHFICAKFFDRGLDGFERLEASSQKEFCESVTRVTLITKTSLKTVYIMRNDFGNGR